MAVNLRKRIREQPQLKFKIMRTSSEGCSERTERSNILASCLNFEYGPSELNLFDYIAEEARFLWTRARKYLRLKPESEPTRGILLFHTEGENLSLMCRKHLEFDLHSTSFSEVDLISYHPEDFACIVYLGKHFWKLMQKENIQPLKEIVKKLTKSHIFFITESEKEKIHAVNICRKNKLCPLTHVFSNGSDKALLYQTMYEILENQITSFLSDLECRVATRYVDDTTLELKDFYKKLQLRKEKPKCSLTKQCIEEIKGAYDAGCVGYWLHGNKLYIFEDNIISQDNTKKLQIKNSIREAFKDGTVVFKSLNDVISPQCAILCGGSVGKMTGETGTIGIFGKLRNGDANKAKEEIIVAISSGHVIDEDADAFVPGKGNIGKCIWPVPSSNNMFDVSVIKINTSHINSLQRFILDENVTLTQISEKDLTNRRVFKFGATTGRTDGFVNTFEDCEVYGEKVLVIKPQRSKNATFSDDGDSGAIVLTRKDDKLQAVGVIYGNFESRDFKSVHGKESSAVFLINALNRFKDKTKQEILLDKI